MKMKVFILLFISLMSVRARPQAPSGLVLQNIEKGSVYEKLGLKAGDRIKKINGQAITDPGEAKKTLEDLKAAKRINLVIDRGGKEQVLHFREK